MPFGEATRTWFAISLQTFGGPAGQIARHATRSWSTRSGGSASDRFLHALSFCTLLPGPEAQQLAIYIGWLLNGIRGGLVAGTLFVLPGVVSLLALSAIYVSSGDSTVVTALFAGLGAAVLAIVVQAVVRVGGPRARAPRAGRAGCRRICRAMFVFGVAFPDRDRRRRRNGMGDWVGGHPATMRASAVTARPTTGHAADPGRRLAQRATQQGATPRKVLAVGLIGLGDPGRAVVVFDRRAQRVQPTEPVLLRRRTRHLRRRLRRAGLRGTEGCRGLRLASAR